MFADRYFANRYFAPRYFASVGAAPPVSTMGPIYYRRADFADEWSTDGATWVEADLNRALFQLYIDADLGGGLTRHNLFRLEFVWMREL